MKAAQARLCQADQLPRCWWVGGGSMTETTQASLPPGRRAGLRDLTRMPSLPHGRRCLSRCANFTMLHGTMVNTSACKVGPLGQFPAAEFCSRVCSALHLPSAVGCSAVAMLAPLTEWGSLHMEMSAVGFEPTRSYLQWILSPPP